MGVQLTDLVTKHEMELEALKGRKIGIDAFVSLYQFLSIIRQYDGTPLMDSRGRVTSHYSGLFYRTIKLIEKGIKPAYVFDGKPPKLKSRTIEERVSKRDEAKEKWQKALKKGDLEEARKYAQASTRLSKEMVKGAKELLKAMGVPIIQAPSEGEAQAAYMNIKGDIWATGSQDYDSLLFGAPRLIKNVTITGKRKIPRKNIYIEIKPELIELKELLKELEIDRKKLIWIGIMVGTDFNDKLPGIGPKTALKLVKEYDRFEEILEHLRETKKIEFNFDYHEIEEIFLKIPTTDDYKLKWKAPDVDKVKEFLVEEHDFSEDRVENALDELEKHLKTTMSQGRLDNWT